MRYAYLPCCGETAPPGTYSGADGAIGILPQSALLASNRHPVGALSVPYWCPIGAYKYSMFFKKILKLEKNFQILS